MTTFPALVWGRVLESHAPWQCPQPVQLLLEASQGWMEESEPGCSGAGSRGRALSAQPAPPHTQSARSPVLRLSGSVDQPLCLLTALGLT